MLLLFDLQFAHRALDGGALGRVCQYCSIWRSMMGRSRSSTLSQNCADFLWRGGDEHFAVFAFESGERNGTNGVSAQP